MQILSYETHLKFSNNIECILAFWLNLNDKYIVDLISTVGNFIAIYHLFFPQAKLIVAF